MKWLEVSLPASAEAAEAVADVLAGFAPNGTAISGELQPEAPLTVQAFLPAETATEDVRQRIREAIWHLSQIVALPEPSFRLIEEEDWAESWKVNFRPLAIGRRLLVLPPWIAPSDPTRLRLVLDPGMAFGTGAHPTTRMCLVALENLVQPGDFVIDLGCGSGILSVASLLLGAGRVWACHSGVTCPAARASATSRSITSPFSACSMVSIPCRPATRITWKISPS